VLPLADTSVWSRLADGILLVAREGTTRKRELQRGLEMLDHSKVLGLVLNSSESIDQGNSALRAETRSLEKSASCWPNRAGLESHTRMSDLTF
jgi:Mrp family chromosome partitioning ATPase